MEIVNTEIPWTIEDTQALADWFQTRPGSRMLPKLTEYTPVLLAGGPTNEILIRAGELRGFQKAVHALLAMSVVESPQKTQDATAYPRLEDDDAHNDGQRLSEEPAKD